MPALNIFSLARSLLSFVPGISDCLPAAVCGGHILDSNKEQPRVAPQSPPQTGTPEPPRSTYDALLTVCSPKPNIFNRLPEGLIVTNFFGYFVENSITYVRVEVDTQEGLQMGLYMSETFLKAAGAKEAYEGYQYRKWGDKPELFGKATFMTFDCARSILVLTGSCTLGRISLAFASVLLNRCTCQSFFLNIKKEATFFFSHSILNSCLPSLPLSTCHTGSPMAYANYGEVWCDTQPGRH